MLKKSCSALLISLIVAGSGSIFPALIAQVRIPQIDYKERTLANGLKVYSVRNTSSPTVAINVWYKVGSKDDPANRSGFAHLFEHMMFKATKNMKPETFDRLTEDVGGYNNASTWPDYTYYHEVVPSNYLETLLWAEADRMGSLVVEDSFFKSERDVVEEEYRQRVLAQPYGRLFYLLLNTRSYTTHPYKRPTIGSIEDLEAATIDDVRAFHATYYRPDNAVLIVVGDFDQKQLDAWVDKYFAGIPRPDKPVPRVQSKEPERRAEQRFTEYGPNVPLPAVAITYLVPPAASSDAMPLQIAEAILSAGESSRLYQSLVYEQQIAQEAFASYDRREDESLFYLGAILASGKRPDEAERALLAEVTRMQQQPVAAAELDKVKNQLITSALRERETNNGKAEAIGYAVTMYGDAARVNTDLDRLRAVTAADVQRVMQKYFTAANRVVISYQQETRQPAGDKAGARSGPQPDSVGAARKGGTR